MSEPSGVGYGGDRPGIWVEPKRDEAVSLEACTIKACNKDWVVTPTKKDNKILYTVSNADQQKICCITTDDSLTSQQLESILIKELGKAMDLKAYQRISHDDHADEIITINEPNEEALLFCPISGEMRWTPYIPEHKQHQPLATPEAYPAEGSKKEADKVTGDPNTFHCFVCQRDYPLSEVGRKLQNNDVYCRDCWKGRQRLVTEINSSTLDKGPSDEAVNELAWEMYHAHWNALGTKEQDAIYKALGFEASLNKKAGTWELPDSPKRAQRLVNLLDQATKGQMGSVKLFTHDLYSVFGDDVLFDELDQIETANASVAVPIVKDHLNRMLKLYAKNPDNFSEDWDPKAWAILQPLLPSPLKLPVRQIPDDLKDLASKRATLNKKAELIREIHKATDQYNYNGTEYNLSNGTLKKDQVIPLSKTHVRLTDPTKSRYERYAGNGEWQLISDVDFAKYKAEWDEINKANYGPKATAEKVVVRRALLEDLKKNCPDCYAKFEKFAKEKGVRIIIDKRGTQSFKPGDTVALRKDWISLLQEQFGQGASYWEDEVSSLIHRQPGAENDPEFSTIPLKVERVGDISVDSDNSFPVYVDVVIVDGVEIPESIVEKQVTKQADLDQLLKQVETIRTRINTVKERIQSSGSKKKAADQIPGGLADTKKPEDFDQAQLEKGIKVEMEHTDDPEKAKEIAMDHLVEDAVYYDKLQQMENKDTHPIEENAVVELVKWIELDLDMIENAYRDRPEVIQHIESIENQITELEQKLGLEHAKPIHEMEEKEHKKASLTRYICPDCNKPTVEEGYLGWRECTRPRCGWKEGPQPSTLTEVEVKESFLKTQLQKKFAAHIQRGDAYVLRLLEDFDYEYEKDVQAILANGSSVDERFAAIKMLIPELFDRLIDDKQINIKQVEWSPVQVDDQDIMKLIEDHDDNKEDSVEKESAAYKVPKPTTPPPQGFQWAYDPKLASWNLVATE